MSPVSTDLLEDRKEVLPLHETQLLEMIWAQSSLVGLQVFGSRGAPMTVSGVERSARRVRKRAG
jgi:hypothetical protein